MLSWLSPSYLKNLLLSEIEPVQGFMHLLMKPRNNMPWLPEDKALLRRHLRRLARTLPLLGVFALPGGSFLMPLLAIFLDRRKKSRRSLGELTAERARGKSGD